MKRFIYKHESERTFSDRLIDKGTEAVQYLRTMASEASVAKTIERVHEVGENIWEQVQDTFTPPEGVKEVPLEVVRIFAQHFLNNNQEGGIEAIMQWDREQNGEDDPEAGYGVYRLIGIGGTDVIVITDPHANDDIYKNTDKAFGRLPKLLEPLVGIGVPGQTPSSKVWEIGREAFDSVFQQGDKAFLQQTVLEEMLDARWRQELQPGSIINPFTFLKKLTVSVIARLSISDCSSEEAKRQKQAMEEALPIIEREFVKLFGINAALSDSESLKKFLKMISSSYEQSDDAFSGAMGKMKDAISWVIAQEKEKQTKDEPSNSIVRKLLEYRYTDSTGEEAALTDEELEGAVLSSFIAGSATTATTLAWLEVELAKNPQFQEVLSSKMKPLLQQHGGLKGILDKGESLKSIFSDPVFQEMITETLRLYPPVSIIMKKAEKEGMAGGRKIRKGSVILMALHPAQLDPRYFGHDQADATVFYPPRIPRGHAGMDKEQKLRFAPWTRGATQCAGMNFAIMEMLATLALFEDLQIRLDRSIQPHKPEANPFPKLNGALNMLPDSDYHAVVSSSDPKIVALRPELNSILAQISISSETEIGALKSRLGEILNEICENNSGEKLLEDIGKALDD